MFGADASLEQTVSKTFSLSEVASQVDGAATNIARALQVGLASFPAHGARQLVLLTDGNENVASAVDAAVIARSLGVAVFPLPLDRLTGKPEVRVQNLIVPRQVNAGTPYHIEAVVFSSFETPASLELFRGGHFAGRRKVTLQPGKNRFSFLQRTNQEGVHLYQLVVNSPSGLLSQYYFSASLAQRIPMSALWFTKAALGDFAGLSALSGMREGNLHHSRNRV